MFTVFSSTVRSHSVVKVIDEAGLDEALSLALKWTHDNPGKTVTVRQYISDTEYRVYMLSDDSATHGMRKLATLKDVAPTAGRVVIVFPAQEKAQKRAAKPATKPAPVPEIRAQWEIAVMVESDQWTMLARKDGQELAKTGTFERAASGQATYLQGVWAALSTIKRGRVGRVVLTVGDRNVARMLKGEMQSKKNSAALEQCRLIINALGCVEIAPL